MLVCRAAGRPANQTVTANTRFNVKVPQDNSWSLDNTRTPVSHSLTSSLAASVPDSLAGCQSVSQSVSQLASWLG